MKNIINKLIYELKLFIKLFRKYNSIHQIDKKVYKYLNYKNGFYIEIGAFDGVNQSNTWFYEKELNWSGLLIEPNPKFFKKLTKYRNKKNIFCNKLITNDMKLKKTFLTDEEAYSKRINKKINNEKIYKIKSSSLFEVLKRNKLLKKKIDFFSLDVEGDELEILKSMKSCIKNVKLFVIEANVKLNRLKDYKKKHKEIKKYKEITKYLNSKNFKFYEKLSQCDFLFVDKKYFK